MNREVVTYFAETDARGKRVAFGIKSRDRTRHVYVIGKTGMGKSTLLENMAVQDMRNGEALAFIDPHGKTAELLLDFVPESRLQDVLYFAPFDTDYPISFNVMEDVGPARRHLVASGLMSSFKKIWVDAWSARMEYILNNILLALLEFPDSTLLGVNRMLADKEYRKRVVDNVSDVSVKAFWTDEFAKYGDRYMQEAGAAIQNKVGQFISNPLIRNIVGQPHSTFDLRKMMDGRKIIIMNLSKGRVGETNANLLGSMLVTKIYLAAMSRADTPELELRKLPNFYLYVDEFQSFANESFADILSEARKYKLNLTVAHQYIEQMADEVRAAIFGNVGTMIVFRVGAYDAEVLEKEFTPQFSAEDMVNLGFAQVYLKLMIDGITSPPFSATTLPPFERPKISFRDKIIDNSRRVFARPKVLVEQTIVDWSQSFRSPPPPPRRERLEGSPARPGSALPVGERKGMLHRQEGNLNADEPMSPPAEVPARAQRADWRSGAPARRDDFSRGDRRHSVPLEALKQKTPRQTAARSERSREELRTALATLLKGEGVSFSSRHGQSGTGEAAVNRSKPKSEPPAPAGGGKGSGIPSGAGRGGVSSARAAGAVSRPNEIPENVLRGILEPDDNDGQKQF